ncbi:hypothetical protein BX666DRAFT_1981585 [Dichotomocladium elegans]|nr:hypothetical protein BX666DRAFT_1981585 [Dichotomocladium elegans]
MRSRLGIICSPVLSPASCHPTSACFMLLLCFITSLSLLRFIRYGFLHVHIPAHHLTTVTQNKIQNLTCAYHVERRLSHLVQPYAGRNVTPNKDDKTHSTGPSHSLKKDPESTRRTILRFLCIYTSFIVYGLSPPPSRDIKIRVSYG